MGDIVIISMLSLVVWNSDVDSVASAANDQDIPLIVGEPDSLAKGVLRSF